MHRLLHAGPHRALCKISDAMGIRFWELLEYERVCFVYPWAYEISHKTQVEKLSKKENRNTIFLFPCGVYRLASIFSVIQIVGSKSVKFYICYSMGTSASSLSPEALERLSSESGRELLSTLCTYWVHKYLHFFLLLFCIKHRR